MWSEYWWLITIFIIIFVFLVVLGSAWHFFYEWSGNNRVVGYFAPVNESFWEHLKLIIFPLLLFFIVLYFATFWQLRNWPFGLFVSTLAAIIFMIIFFYLYTWSNVNNSILWVDILLYVLAMAVALVVLFFSLICRYIGDVLNYLSLAFYIVLLILVFWWTYNPPCNCGFWEEPEHHH